MENLLTGAAAINKAIDSIARRGLKLDTDIQHAALSVIKHHAEHGDVTLINRLVAAMPKGSRVNALREFLNTFSAAVYDEDTKEFKHAKGKADKLVAAMDVMWTDFKQEAAYKPIDNPVEALSQLIARFERDRKMCGDKSQVPDELIAGLKTFRTEQTVAH